MAAQEAEEGAAEAPKKTVVRRKKLLEASASAEEAAPVRLVEEKGVSVEGVAKVDRDQEESFGNILYGFFFQAAFWSDTFG